MRSPARVIPPLIAIALVALGSTVPAMAQNGTLNFSPSPLVFCTEPGQGISEVPVFISTSSGIVDFTSVAVTSDGNWLTVTPTSGTVETTPTVLFYAAIKGGLVTLPTGTYNGQIVLSGNGAVVGRLAASLVVSTTPCGNTGSGLISATPGAVTFQVPPGTAGFSQTVQIHSTFPTGVATSVDAVTAAGPDWLSVFNNLYLDSYRTTPLSVSVSTVGLQAGRTYTGTIEMDTSTGATLTIPVTLNLTTSAGNIAPTASPAALTFNLPFASPAVTQQIQITNPSSLPIDIITGPGVFNGSNWLSVSPQGELIQANSTVVLNATITSAGLVSGQNTGAVGLYVTSGGAASLNIPVTVNYGVSTGSPLSVAPAQLSFASATGTASPLPQNLSLTSSTSNAFSALVTTSSGGNWLTASPLSGATTGASAPTNIKVQVNPSGLTPRTYLGQILITNTNTGVQQAIPVSLKISDLPILTLGNSAATFAARTGSSILPAQQTVTLTSSGSELAFTTSVTPVSGGNFLLVAPSSGTTPQTLTLSLNPSVVPQLAANSYVANVMVTSSGAGNSPLTYPVTMNVTNTPLLKPNPSSLNFNYQTGQAQPASQFISIGSTDDPQGYSVTASTSNCSGFLSAAASSGNTPDTIAVTVNTAGLPAGTCNGTVAIISAKAGNSPLSVPVTLNIGTSPALNVSPGAIQVAAQVGTNAASQIILLSSTDGTTPLSFTVTSATDTSSGWLSADPASGKTPNSLNVTFNTAGLPVGTYMGRIVVTVPGARPVTVPVSVTITSSATLSTSPSSLTFSQSSQGPAPATQTLQVLSTVPGIAFKASATASNGGTWLTVSNATGVTPGALTVSVNGAALSPGTYTGIVTITSSSSTLNILVTLTVTPTPTLSLSSTALTFNYQSGATPAQAQPIQVTSTGGSVPFAATTAANFLTLTQSTGVTPATVSVGLNATALATLSAGQYSGTVTISSANIPGVTQKLNVTLVVTPAPGSSLVAVVNAASLRPGPVAPGEIITLFGSNLGPPDGVGFALTPQGTVPTTLANMTVTFDGNLAPLTFVNATQINAIVPYEMAGRASASVIVSRSGVASAPFAVKVADTTPAIFSLTQTGNGQGAILNQDSSVNGPNSPAATGSVIQIFATGEGRCQGVATGSLTPALPPFPKPAASVSVTIGGKPAQLQYEGEAPGAIAGLLQVNAFVPDGLASGPQTVVLTVGNNSNNSQTITVTVQ